MKHLDTFGLAALLVFLIFMTHLLVSLPSCPPELLLNERSFCEALNEEDFERINRHLHSVLNETSAHESVIRAQVEAKAILEMLPTLRQLLTESQQWRGDRDSVKKRLDRVLVTINERLPVDGVVHSFLLRMKMDEKIKSQKLYKRTSEHYGLSLTFLESDIIGLVSVASDSLAMIAGSVNFKFDILTDIKPQEGVAWVKGQIAFNPPNQMRLDQKERIQVRISKKYSKEIMATMSSQESVVSDSLPVGNIMMVKLIGDDFQIVAFDDEEQGVTNDGYTQWEFDVTPKSSGKHELFVKAGIVYYVPNLGPAKKYFPVYEKAIQVEVSAWQVIAGFATQRWEFIVSTIVIPVGVWGFSRFRARRRSLAPKTKDEIPIS